MRMGKILFQTGKIVLSGFISLIVLSFISVLYYNYGIRKTNHTGATDYYWENRFYCQMYEGFGVGYRDRWGFNNSYGMPDSEKVDVLLMGSSQMEANNVPWKCSAAYRVNDLFRSNKYDINVYNIAMEGHDLSRQIHNLPDALDEYNPSGFVILEQMGEPDFDNILKCIEGGYERSPAFDTGWIYYFQRIPYFRIARKQLSNIKMAFSAADNGSETGGTREMIRPQDCLTVKKKRILKYISDVCNEHNCTPVLLYLSGRGSGGGFAKYYDIDSEWVELCRENGVVFIDTDDEFEKDMNEKGILPYGFWGGEYGSGHLNSNGHAAVARTLFTALTGFMD